MRHEGNTNDKEHLKNFDVSSSQMRSVSIHEIVNSCPSIQSDRITRYASPNRFDIRDTPRSFLDSYRTYRYSQNNGVNLCRSKLRSTMPTSFSSYAVPSLNEVKSSMSTSKSLDINVAKNQEELLLQSGDRCCDKYISSVHAKEVSIENQPVSYENSSQLNSIGRHPSNQLTTYNNTPNHNSNSSVKISHHHTPITKSIVYSSSPSSTIYTNEPLIHRNPHPNQHYSSYCQEISKPCLSSKRHSVISQSITNNNIVSNDVNNGNNDRLESKINSMSKNYCIVVQKEFEQTCDKNHSQVNYDSCNKRPITDPGDYLSNTEQIKHTKNKIDGKTITFINNKKPSVNLHLTEDTHGTPIQKQTNYPFKANTFRSVKNKHKNHHQKTINRQQSQQQQHQDQQQQNKLNYENEMSLKPEIKLIDSRPRTRLCIQSGIKTHTKTMTLQKNLITDDSLISDDLNMTGFISLPNKKVSTKKVTSKLPTSPSMPLPNLISTDHYIYNVNLSEIDHYSEPYNSSSTCESLIEYKQTDKLIMDHQNDPELTMKLDRIACEIGLLHDQRRIRRESSLSSQYDIDGLMSINSPCSESNLPKADLDQLLTLEISTTLSNPAYVSSSKNDTTTVQTISTSLNNSKIADSRHRTHLSRVDSSLTNANKLKSQSRPNSTGSRIIKEFLRHISPKLGHSLSRISSRKKSEYQKSNQDNRETNFESPQSTSTSFERCKSERIYPKKSLLRFIPRCSSRSKERKTKQISTTEANTQIIPSYSSNTNIIRSDTNKATIDEDKKSNHSLKIEQQFPSLSHNHHRNQYYSRYYENDFNQHPQSRPASIALPVGNDRNDEISFPTYNQLQTNRQINLNNIPKIKEFDHLTSGDHPGPTYLNAALNAFGYGCKPDWKHFCVSPSARRLAHARQSMKVKQIESNPCNITLSNDNKENNEILDNKNNDYDDHETTDEKYMDNKLKQTIEYSCDNDPRQSVEKLIILNNDHGDMFIKQQQHQQQHSNQYSKDDLIILSDKFSINQDTTDKNNQYHSNNDSDQLLINFGIDDIHEQKKKKKKNSYNIVSAIKSKTPPIKRRNTALAIKAKSAKLKQPLNVLLPVNIRCHNKLSTVISKTNEMDCIQLRKKEELTTLFENEQSLTNQDTSTTTTTTTTASNNNNTPSDNLSTLFCSTLSGSTRFDEIDESMKRLSSSSNELYNHSDIVHNNDNPFECIKNSEINTTHLELSINNDRDYVMNLLKYAQTFECQLMNVINLAKGMVDQNNHPINDDLLDSTNENLNNDELLTGIGHIQMLINGNLTMLRKLCKVYLEANSNIKKQQSIEYIPLKSDLEGYWNLILLQYKRLETQFPILVNWISNDFRDELQILIKESLSDLPSCSSEFINSSYMKKEYKKNSTKQTNITSYKKKLSGANKNNKKSIDLHITIQQRIRNARKQMLEKQKNQIIVTKENDIDEQSTYKNTYFYTIEY
ncbi:unnamed protein product [Schistosoma rodhaini]|nr:unnamed protein product [Schistosoma rodhaini]